MVTSVGLSSDLLVSLASFYLRAKFDLSLESLLSEKDGNYCSSALLKNKVESNTFEMLDWLLHNTKIRCNFPVDKETTDLFLTEL